MTTSCLLTKVKHGQMLESSGFTDTRVITPITVRSKNPLDPARINYATIESPTRSSSPTRVRGRSSVYPPYVYNPSQLRSHSPPASIKKKVGGTLRPSTSIKLLRGMFSLWAPAPPLPVDDNNDMDERIARDEDSEISEEEARSRDASRTRAQEWAESVARAALELHTSSISPQPRTVSIPTLNTTIKKHHRPQSGPTRSCPTPSYIVISQPILNFSAPTTAEITPPRSATISVPAASSVVAFTFEPRPLLLSSASSVCNSSASSISFSSRTMGRRVFSRGDREDTDELDELRMSQFDGIGSFGDRVPILGYQSFSLGNFGAGDNGDADLAKSARRQYDDHDDDISGDLSVVEVTGEGLSASQRILSSTLKHWQSLIHFPSSILLPATTPSTTSPSPSELIISLPPAVPLDYSPSLPRPSFLDAPYRQKPLPHSTPLRATKSTLDIRRSEPVHIPATQTVRRKSSTAAMRAPALLKKLSNPALRSKAAISTVTMAYGVMS
jgi:hypothetical protein